MAVLDINNIKYNQPTTSLPNPVNVSRNIFKVHIPKAAGLTNGDWLDLLNIPPHYQIVELSFKASKANAGAYKLGIADAPALAEHSSGSTARTIPAANPSITLAANAIKTTWTHFSAYSKESSNPLNNFVAHDGSLALTLQVTTKNASDDGIMVEFDVGWRSNQDNSRG